MITGNSKKTIDLIETQNKNRRELRNEIIVIAKKYKDSIKDCWHYLMAKFNKTEV